MQAFRYEPDAERIADLNRRIAQAHRVRLAPDTQGRLGIAGADLARLAEGLAGLDWPGFAARVNRWPAYRLTHAGEQVHFVHVPSPMRAAVPVLLLHGWPGSFLDFQELIALLTEAPPAFHVVCPSLPGYGFSTRDLERTCNAAAMADTLAELMQQLGYARFLVQGGDWGSVIAGELARRHAARCLGVHLNLAALRPPPEGDPARDAVLPEEAAWLNAQKHLWADGMGYYAIQSTRPQTLAVALADSPLGLLAWMAEKYLAWSDRDAAGHSLVSDAAILDEVALYWMTDSIGSSMRLYFDEAQTPSTQTRVEVPTGVAVFPREIIKTPRAWVARQFNLVHWSFPARGGHFAALEVPQLLAEDLRAFATQVLGGTA